MPDLQWSSGNQDDTTITPANQVGRKSLFTPHHFFNKKPRLLVNWHDDILF